MKLRQCVFVCKDLESSREELCDILGIEVAYRDPGVAKWGLVNVVCPTGHDFLEIVTPFQQGTSAGRYIERRKGDGGYMVIIQVDDAQAERKRVTDLGVRAVAQKDLPEYKYTHFHPADTSGVLLSLDTTVAPAGRRSRAVVAAGRKGLADACALGRHQRAGRRRDPARRSGQGGRDLVEDPQSSGRWTTSSASTIARRRQIRFVPIVDSRGPGVSAYDVRVVDRERVLEAAHKRGRKLGPAQVEVCGCRINLV